MVGGGAAFATMGGKLYGGGNDERMSLILLYPSLSVFVGEGTTIGAQLLLASASGGDDGITVTGIGPRVTHYFGGRKDSEPVKGRTYPYLTGALLLGHVSWDDGDDATTLTAFTLGGGINHMLASSVGLFAEINYRSDSLKDEHEESETGNSINVFVGFNLFLWE
jgi:hypothetical protein